jgi:Zn-dependent M28 family amino/carboxypeptidase
MRFVNAASNATTNVSIIMKIDVSDAGVGNICADTSTGNATKTIVVGAHSDGVLDGSGINDNGKKSIHPSIN